METPHSSTGSESRGVILINGQPLKSPQIEIPHRPYLLESDQYERLKNIDLGKLTDFLLGAFIGFLLIVISKMVGSSFSDQIKLDLWELYALAISLFATGLSAVVFRFIPSKRKTLVKEIEEHFEQQRQRSRHAK